MKIENHDNFVVLSDDKGSFSDFAPFVTQQVLEHYKGQNVVLDLLKYTHLALEELLVLLEVSTKHRAAKHSFVIINTAINPDDIPPELIVVPTLQEAADIIEMEEIERDLGF